MQSKTSLSAALFVFSAISTAQINNLDDAAFYRGAADQANFYSTLTTNSEYKSDIAAIVSAAPPSAVAQVQSDPANFALNLDPASLAPAWVTAVPTPVLNSLDNLYANADDAYYDVNSIATGSQASAVFANKAIPTSVQSAFTNDPVNFVQALVTATTWPDWATSIPGALQTQVGQVINQQINSFVADFEANLGPYSTPPGFRVKSGASVSVPRTSSGVAAPTSGRPFYPVTSGTACPTCSSCSPVTVIVTVTSGSASTKPTGTPVPVVPATSSRPSSGLPRPSGASTGFSSKATGASGVAPSSVVAFTGSKTGVVPFTGAAAPMRTAAVGAAMLFAGAGALLNA